MQVSFFPIIAAGVGLSAVYPILLWPIVFLSGWSTVMCHVNGLLCARVCTCLICFVSCLWVVSRMAGASCELYAIPEECAQPEVWKQGPNL